MKDTVLGNAGKNGKPIPSIYFKNMKEIILELDPNARVVNNEEILDKMNKMFEKNSHNLRNSYIGDIKYTLCKRKFFEDTDLFFAKSKESYHEISKKQLEYYKKELMLYEKRRFCIMNLMIL